MMFFRARAPSGEFLKTILGGFAQFERSLIITRTGDGRAEAKAKGVKFGRKPKLTPAQRQEAIQRRADGASVRELARSYNVGKSTIDRVTRPHDRQGQAVAYPSRAAGFSAIARLIVFQLANGSALLSYGAHTSRSSGSATLALPIGCAARPGIDLESC
jgi:hypothetical protein